MKTTRVQLDLPQERVREIDRLADDCQIATRKEMFSAAMTLLFWAAKEIKFGNMVASVDPESGMITEVAIPVLLGFASNAEMQRKVGLGTVARESVLKHLRPK